MARTVVLDTSFLRYALMCNIRIEEAIRAVIGDAAFAVPQGIGHEINDPVLEHLIKGWRQFAHDQHHIDDAIVAFAQEHQCAVATMDKELQQRIRNIPRKLVIIRQKNYVELK